MIKDPIVAQVRKVREAYARTFNHDLEAIFHDLQQWQRQTGHVYVPPPKKRKPARKVA